MTTFLIFHKFGSSNEAESLTKSKWHFFANFVGELELESHPNLNVEFDEPTADFLLIINNPHQKTAAQCCRFED